MKRVLACGIVLGSFLTMAAMVGCDSGSPTGNVPPSVTPAKNFTAPEDTKRAKAKSIVGGESDK